jgi:hypothetical protein
MKQLSAILLMGIFSFNIFGYRIVASFLENKENEKMELALDVNAYSENQLISIKQPANLPYYTNSFNFHRIDGEVEIDGVIYKYVKCRIYNDSLEMLCIPNTAKMKIQAAKADFSKMAADFQQSNNKKKSHSDSKSVQKTTSEYEEHAVAASFAISPFLIDHTIKHHLFVVTPFSKTVEQPPEQQLYASLI